MAEIVANVMVRPGLVGAIGRFYLRLVGWQQTFPVDFPMRCVIIVYPHTSNWDFPLGLAANLASGLRANYLGKDALFRRPFGAFFRATGGIPVDRKNPGGLVGAMVAAFAEAKQLRIVIAPEGTRDYVPHLKSGFYRIAVAAHVPLVLTTIDYATKRVAVCAVLSLSGNEIDDMAKIRAAYTNVRGFDLTKMGPLELPASSSAKPTRKSSQ